MFEQLSTAKKLLLPIVDIYQQQKHFSQIYFLSLDLNIVGAFHCFLYTILFSRIKCFIWKHFFKYLLLSDQAIYS